MTYTSQDPSSIDDAAVFSAAFESYVADLFRLHSAVKSSGAFEAGRLGADEWLVLHALKHANSGYEPISLPKLGKASGVSGRRLRKVVNTLQTNGHISTTPNPAGGKAGESVVLQPDGEAALADTSAKLSEIGRALKGGSARGVERAAKFNSRLGKAIARGKREGRRAKGAQQAPAQEV